MHGQLTENFSEARKVDVSLRKVQLMHGKMLTEGCADAKKVDGMSAATRKFDGRSHCHKESSRKVPWMHGKLMEVDGRVCGCKES